MNQPQKLEFRIHRTQWGMGVFSIILAIVVAVVLVADLYGLRQRASVLIGVIMAALAVAAFVARLMLHNRIIVDEEGLTWRGLVRERRASWSQVQHYYWIDKGGDRTPVIETEAGTLKVASIVEQIGVLCVAVQQRASWTKSQDWRRKEAHLGPGDLKIFRYEFHHRGEFIVQLVLVLVSGPAFVVRFFDTSFSSLFSLNGGPNGTFWWQGWLTALGISLVLCLFSMSDLRKFPQMRRALEAHGKETIEVDRNCLCWSDGVQRTLVLWKDVDNYWCVGDQKASGHCVLQSLTGSVTFYPSVLKEADILDEIIRMQLRAVKEGWV